ncbi:MAG: glycosyltransferase, partial [Desulfuromonadales bacterium]
NYEFPPIGGGGANANGYLFREFAGNPELRIDCVTSTMAARDERIPLADNITLHRLAVGKRQLHFWTQREVLHWLWRAEKKAGALLASGHYDLCHAFFGFPSGAVAWRFRQRLPYLVSLRGSDVPGFNPRFSAQYLLLKPLFRRIWRDAGAVVVNSEGLRRLAASFAPDLSLPVVPNGIDTDEFTPGSPDVREAGHILCVSRLVARKGVQHLVEALPAIVAAVPAARLTVVGEGDLAETLQRSAATLGVTDRVDFIGYVPHDQLPALYRRAQLFVQPSFYEGMSNTVLEAMAAGLPIVATGEGGREELYQDNAVTVPHGNPALLAGAISQLLNDSSRCRTMGQVSRTIAERFSWRAVAEQYLAIYDNILASTRQPPVPSPQSLLSSLQPPAPSP